MATKKKQAGSAHDLDRIIVRLPEGLRKRIAQLAAANGRSMTAEVVVALEKHLEGADRMTRLWEFFEKHRENIEEIPHILDAVVNLEWHVERATGASLSGLRKARKAAHEEGGN